MKTFTRISIGILIGIVIGIGIGWHTPKRKIITTTLIEEVANCRNNGGEFWIFPNYESDVFPAYHMTCKKDTTEILSEFNF